MSTVRKFVWYSKLDLPSRELTVESDFLCKRKTVALKLFFSRFRLQRVGGRVILARGLLT